MPGREALRLLNCFRFVQNLVTCACRDLEAGDEEAMRDDFFECMFLLRCKAEMEDDCNPLLDRADHIWRLAGFRDTSLCAHAVVRRNAPIFLMYSKNRRFFDMR